MRLSLRFFAAAAAFAAIACVWADKGFVNLSAFPTLSVADGRSTVTISAEVRDASGRVVSDGTRIRFSTTLGTFREAIVPTVGGIARAVLQASGTPGIAQITASGIGVDSPPTTLDFEFVADRSLLNSAQEYIEVFAPTELRYTADTRYIVASGPGRGVSVRYRDLDLQADDVQINLATNELKARKARVKYGKLTQDFEEFFLRLTQRRGLGMTTYATRRYDAIIPSGRGFAFVDVDAEGKVSLPPEEERFGVVEVRPGKISPTTIPFGSTAFEFTDVSQAVSTIVARKAVVFPRKEIQFQKAEIFVGEARVMRLPLYQLALNRSRSPLVTDDFVNVNDNQLVVNYPYFLSLKPGQTSLLRLRTGAGVNNATSRGYNLNRGVFLDYELNWNKGDQMQGAFTVSGLGRDDWIGSVRQSYMPDDRTTLSGQLQMPAGKSLFGNLNANRQFDGFHADLNFSANRTFDGLPYNREDASFIIEKDPTKVGKLPVRLFYGLEAQSSRWETRFFSDRQDTYGLRLRAESLAIPLDRNTSVTAGMSVRRLFGRNLNTDLALLGNVSLASQLSPDASMVATYTFTQDGFNDQITGRHQLSLVGDYSAGRTWASVSANRSLDLDRMTYRADLSYRLSGLWRFQGGTLFDTYLGDRFIDHYVTVGYKIGWREIGLTWSRNTNRLGVQFLGAGF